MKDYKEQFERLVNIMNDLREKCPWDQKQTIHTLRPLTIEETYELGDAIEKQDWSEMKEEIGDIMLHLIFYSKIAEEQNQFTISDVLDSISEKMITRHPHIYGNVFVENEEDVKRNWQKIKLQKKGKKSVLSGVPSGLPALIKSTRIQEKVKHVGFEWDDKKDAWNKVKEELQEFQEAENDNDVVNMQAEFGDVLFSLVNYARYVNIDPETALDKTNKKFIQRFQFIETQAKAQNKSVDTMSLEEMNILWEKAKSELKNSSL
ncbi:nucleoside triphosphate pyrophosphohydrolase [Rhizosphaericola mali]|uniref:Nucleoside triphosphate pyrophosphohydrolase n=2 Tax=Rhizosphaericola mali TaxID=2545455 RepID=A0A5P2G1F3_9BACT|nr:nucleoside triphosphate pyrophosphohydrolase [Rhizosphaericola mali]